MCGACAAMTIIKQLQKNKKFRSILKQQKIGWRNFVRCHYFGLTNYVTGLQSVGMGKWNHVHNYTICMIQTERISRNEYRLIDVFFGGDL